MRISDCSSDVCSSDLVGRPPIGGDVLTEGVRVEQAHLAIHFAGELLKEVVGPSLVGLRLGELAERKNHKAIGHYDVLERKRVVEGKSVSLRVDLGGRRLIKNNTQINTQIGKRK